MRKVLALSETEEAARKREEDERLRKIDEQNSKALFDDSLQMYVSPFCQGTLSSDVLVTLARGCVDKDRMPTRESTCLLSRLATSSRNRLDST